MSDRSHGNKGFLLSEAAYFIKRSAHWISSKISTAVLNEGRPTHAVKSSGAIKVGGGFKAFGQWVAQIFPDEEAKEFAANLFGGAVLVGVISVISAVLAQMDYRHWVDNVKKFYKDELSTRLGKAPGSLTENDVYTLEKGDASRGIAINGTFAEEVSKLKKHRTETVLVSIVASLSAFAGIGLLADAGLFAAALAPVMVPVAGAIAANSLLAWGAELLAEGLVGLVIYNAVKTPLHWATHKMFNLDYETAHERIAQMQRDFNDGKAISQERVLEVFAHANPQIDKETLRSKIPLAELTNDINSGKFKVTELAFTVQGQMSTPEEPVRPQLGIIRKCFNGVCHILHIPTQEMAKPESAVTPPPAPPPVIEYDNPTPARPFAERFGLARADTSVGYVERLDKQAADAALSGAQIS